MNKFVEAHADNIHAEISCVDRIIFKGYSSLSWADNMESYLSYNNILIKDFKKYAQSLSHRLRDHGLSMAHKLDRPYFKPSGKYNKEELAREIAAKDNITSGLVAVMSAIEASPTFKMVPGEGRPKLINASIPQLCLYYYFMIPEFGLMHIRIQTWLPFSVQIYLNGHDWLARQMDKHEIKYHQADNCFIWIEKPEEAQKLADQFNRLKWEKVLPKFAKLVNPLSPDEFCANYYWVLDQVEYATDIMFKNSADLDALYEKLLEHSIKCFGAKDVLTFLGKKFDGRFTGDQINSMKKRHPGARVKHWIRNNWMKMYNKFGSVLRVETVINDPYSFKILRHGKRNGELVYGWFPMAKGVANLYRYGEIGFAANHAYLDALAIVRDDRPAKESLQKLTEPVRRKGKSYGAFNPLRFEEIRLFQSVMNGNFIAFGFQNRDIRETIFGGAGSRRETARLSAKIGRYLKKLQMHGLIAKVPRSRRWKVTPYGWQTMQAAIEIYNVGWAQVIDRQVA
ncbi:MAG: hypothetical protein PHV82_03070 [Victivallaceae bacterium]|nr:hypothetical protein [Victivallaceae bacterium]